MKKSDSTSKPTTQLLSVIKRLETLPKSFQIFFFLLITGGVLLGTSFLVGLLLYFLVGPNIRQPLGILCYNLLTFTASIYLLVILPGKLHAKWSTSREQLGLSGLLTWTDLFLAPISFVAFTIISLAITALFTLLPWFNLEQPQNVGFTNLYDFTSRLIGFLSLVIITPIVEEVIFRGWLYGKLRAKLNLPLALVLNSLLFAALHGQWNVGVNVFALSAVLCLQREITGTIYSGIILHMLKNGIAFLILFT